MFKEPHETWYRAPEGKNEGFGCKVLATWGRGRKFSPQIVKSHFQATVKR